VRISRLRRAMKASSFSRISSAAGWICKRFHAYKDLPPATGRQHPRIRLIPWTFNQVGITHRHLLFRTRRDCRVRPRNSRLRRGDGCGCVARPQAEQREIAGSRYDRVCLMRASVILCFSLRTVLTIQLPLAVL